MGVLGTTRETIMQKQRDKRIKRTNHMSAGGLPGHLSGHVLHLTSTVCVTFSLNPVCLRGLTLCFGGGCMSGCACVQGSTSNHVITTDIKQGLLVSR